MAFACGHPIEERASPRQTAFTMILGLGFALISALGTNLSGLFKARGAVLAKPIQVRHPWHSAASLFRQRWFAVGWIVALFAWGLHVEALSLAPLSTVQAIQSEVVLVVNAVLGQAREFRRRQAHQRDVCSVTAVRARHVEHELHE